MRVNPHCVKSVQIQSYFWSVFSCIRTEYRKIRTRNNSVFGHFSRSAYYSRGLYTPVKGRISFTKKLLKKKFQETIYPEQLAGTSSGKWKEVSISRSMLTTETDLLNIKDRNCICYRKLIYYQRTVGRRYSAPNIFYRWG